MKNLLLVILLHIMMWLIKMKILYPLAVTALRRLEKLTSINKKISNETINT